MIGLAAATLREGLGTPAALQEDGLPIGGLRHVKVAPGLDADTLRDGVSFPAALQGHTPQDVDEGLPAAALPRKGFATKALLHVPEQVLDTGVPQEGMGSGSPAEAHM